MDTSPWPNPILINLRCKYLQRVSRDFIASSVTLLSPTYPHVLINNQAQGCKFYHEKKTKTKNVQQETGKTLLCFQMPLSKAHTMLPSD